MRAKHDTNERKRRQQDAQARGSAWPRPVSTANRSGAAGQRQEVPYDRLLIATGVRSRPWPNTAEAALEGVFTLRTCDDAGRLQAALAAKPRRVLIIGAGFIGSEMASVCRELGLEVTVAERAARRSSARSAG